MKVKTEKQVLEQTYMNSDDLNIICPMCRTFRNTFINDIRKEMKEKGYYVPMGKTKLALTKLVKQKLGIEEGKI